MFGAPGPRESTVQFAHERKAALAIGVIITGPIRVETDVYTNTIPENPQGRFLRGCECNSDFFADSKPAT
jgi:hypothetical protein